MGSSAPSMATVSGTSETTSGCDCVDIVYLREREADYCAGMSGERREGRQAPSVFVSGFRAPTDFRESGAEAATPRQCSSDGAILSQQLTNIVVRRSAKRALASLRKHGFAVLQKKQRSF